MKLFQKIKKEWVLIIILLIAALLRLWKLGSIPPGLTPDEAALGYNAYSILKTGRDEFGQILPIIFKSFGDYKPGLYVYFDIPFVALLGLNEFSARLPSAIAGILSVWLIYQLAYSWHGKKFGLMAAFVAAINPYLIYFSRGAWEANVALTLTLFGVYYFLKALYKSRYFKHSAVFFASTLLTYQGAKLSTLIVVCLLAVAYWKPFWSFNEKYQKIKKKNFIVSVLLAIIISLPVILSLLTGHAQRLTIFSIFSYPRPDSELQTYAGPFFNLFHSNQLNYVRMILSRFFNFFSGQFLFFAGDSANPVHTAPYEGVLLLVDLLLLPIGLFSVVKNKITKDRLFIIGWLLLAPLPAILSRDQTNAVRSLNAAIPLVVIVAFGLDYVINFIRKQRSRIISYVLLFSIYAFSALYFLDAYFIHVPMHNSELWRYGYKEAVSYVSGVESNYNNIVFEQSFNQPYVYFLFYNKYDPGKWQNQAKLVDSEYKGDVGYEESIDNVKFKKIDWQQLKNMPGTLVVSKPTSLPPDYLTNANLLKEIKYLNGLGTAFNVIQIK